MDNLINPISEFIKQHKRDDTFIKFTLGKYTQEFGFDNQLFNIINYKKIKVMLESYNGWEDISDDSHEYIDERPINTMGTMVIQYETGPYDILISAETREKKDITDEYNLKTSICSYTKKHHTFVVKDYEFISGDNIQKFELYLINTSICSKYLAHSSILKIKDITGVCQKPDIDIFKIIT